MSLTLIAIVFIAAIVLGYTLYGRLVARQYALDDDSTTPAVKVNDGVDFVPTRRFFLLGQHFSAIAAAGPIAGPILACTLFGWGPAFLWIALGVIFIGAVHDFSALVASVRHGARSIAEIVKENLGRRAWLAMLAFIWIALVYLIIAFADITAATFVGKTEELQGNFAFNKGGAVAVASTTYLVLAIVMGFLQQKAKAPLWLMTLIFVPATLGAVWLGTQISTLLVFSQTSWSVAIMLYCFVASLLPVWMLLQPRGYLGGFVLYLALAIGLVGIFFGGFDVKQPIVTAAPMFGLTQMSMLPFLFVTIACGACSGFHGLVCSGTTSKQIAKESDCKPVGYGGMLLEGLVAVIALATIMIVAPEAAKGAAPGRVYGDGIARFLAVILGEGSFIFAATFGAMAFSTFVFDTLDVATRLGRYILQELSGKHGRGPAMTATAVTAAVPAVILVAAGPGAYRTFWTLFGTSNQLLAALTLLAISVWLKRSGKRYWFTFAPMLFLMTVTMWSLAGQAIQFSRAAMRATAGQPLFPSIANTAVAVLLFVLTAFLVVEARRAVKQPLPQAPVDDAKRRQVA